MKFYLAGPMTGIPQFNIPTFDRVAKILRDAGYDIISPAELDSDEIRAAALASETGSHDDIPPGDTWGSILARDVHVVADDVDGIIFLPGWAKSRGARLEAFVGLLCNKEFRQINFGLKDVTGHEPLYLSTLSSDWVRSQVFQG